MKRWRVSFLGRRSGAIGIFERFTVEAVGVDSEAAVEWLYDNGYEHISGAQAVEIIEVKP